MSPRTGRPTEEPKNIRVGVRLTEKEEKISPLNNNILYIFSGTPTREFCTKLVGKLFSKDKIVVFF